MPTKTNYRFFSPKVSLVNKLLWLGIIIFAIMSWMTDSLLPLSGISFDGVFDFEKVTPAGHIFWDLRLPRSSLAFLTGAVLSLCGMVFQSIFRNNLATPFTLGVASGASLGAALYIVFGLPIIISANLGIGFAAFLGAISITALVNFLGSRSRLFDTHSLLLAGVALSFIISSIIMAIQYSSEIHDSYQIMRWTMGGLDTVGFADTIQVLLVFIIGSIFILFHTEELNILSIGDELAMSRGLNIGKCRKKMFIITSIMVGGTVAITGPIGFIGMVVPHICRLILGPNHNNLFPSTILLGGAILTICDCIAHNVLSISLPVGIITPLLGGPFFLWLLFKNNK